MEPKRGKSIVSRLNHDGLESRCVTTFSECQTWAQAVLCVAAGPDHLPIDKITMIEYQPITNGVLKSKPLPPSVYYPELAGLVWVVSNDPTPSVDCQYTHTPPTSSAESDTPDA